MSPVPSRLHANVCRSLLPWHALGDHRIVSDLCLNSHAVRQNRKPSDRRT